MHKEVIDLGPSGACGRVMEQAAGGPCKKRSCLLLSMAAIWRWLGDRGAVNYLKDWVEGLGFGGPPLVVSFPALER